MEYRLEEIFDLKMGKTPSRNNLEYWNADNHKWISIADLSKCGKYINETKEYLSDKAVEESGINLIPANTVVMSFKLSIGKIAITKEAMYSNEAIMAFHDKLVVELLPDYIYYLFKAKNWDEGTNKAVMGKTLNKATLSKMMVHIHQLEEQKKIIEILDKVSSIISACEVKLQKYDDLIKARFVELTKSLDNWKSIGELCSIVTDGTHQPPKFQSSGIPFIFVSNLAENKVTYDTAKFISEETYRELYKRTPIQRGDLLLTTVGSYGHPAIVEEDRRFLFQRHIAYLKPKQELISSYYLYGALLSPEVQRQIEEKVKGIAQKTLNLSEIRKIVIPVPSMEEQMKYEYFVKQVDKSKLNKIAARWSAKAVAQFFYFFKK